MIRSMTAFTREERQYAFGTLVWELRSVNHRYLETALRLPDALRDLEMTVRDRLRQRLSRGKVDASLRFEPAARAEGLALNEVLALELVQAAQRIAGHMTESVSLNPVDILRWPGVIASTDMDHELIATEALGLLDQTLKNFVVVREREGVALAQHIEEKLAAMLQEAERVRTLVPGILATQKEKLLARLAEIRGNLDTDRLEQEMVYLAQRMDVDEELKRLDTHITETRRVLAEGGSVGRRLDFLMQELNRESNTLGSKSVHADTSQSSVSLKVLIEQMREQVQNIE